MFENSGAVRQNIATKDSMKKLIVDELTVWFGNARDRRTGGHRLLKSAQFRDRVRVDHHRSGVAQYC